MNTTKPTPEEVKQIEAKIVQQLRARLEAFDIKPTTKKGLDHQANFLCGAMAAIEAIYPSGDPQKISPVVPPSWVFTIMRGRSVLEA